MRGAAARIKGFKKPSTVPRMSFAASIQRLLFGRIARHALRVEKKVCTACCTCEKACPVGAIKVDKEPAFDEGKCILCYCCYAELCPEHAISLNPLTRFLQRTA